MHGNSFERKLAILKGRPSIEVSDNCFVCLIVCWLTCHAF